MDNTEIQSVIDEIRTVRRQTAAWRTSLTVVLLAVVVICTFLMWNTVSSLAAGKNRDEFVQQLTAELQKSIVPSLQDVGKQALQRIDLNKQVSDLNKRAPDVANAAMAELRTLSTNIPEHGKKVLTDKFTSTIQSHSSALQTQFSEVSQDQIEAFMSALTEETQEQLAIATNEMFAEHLDVMNDIVADIDKIEAVEGPAATADIPTWQMALMIVDIARADFTLEAPAKATATAGKGKK